MRSSTSVALVSFFFFLSLLAPLSAEAEEVAFVTVHDALYRIDLATGTSTLIGTVEEPGKQNRILALTFSPVDRRLYGLVSEGRFGDPDATARVGVFDRQTAAFTPLFGDLLVPAGWGGMTFDACGRLWISNEEVLYRLDPGTGAFVEVGEHDGLFPVQDLSARGEQLFAAGEDGVRFLDPETGAVGEIAFPGRVMGVDFGRDGTAWILHHSGLLDPPPPPLLARVEPGGETTFLPEAPAIGRLAVAPAAGACPSCLLDEPLEDGFALAATGKLWRVAPEDGGIAAGPDLDPRTRALAVSPSGILHGLSQGFVPITPPQRFTLLEAIDAATGTVHSSRELSFGSPHSPEILDMVFDAGGAPWLTDGGRLFRADLATGEVASVGGHGVPVVRLAARGEDLFATDGVRVYTLDRSTGAAEATGVELPGPAPAVPEAASALAFDAGGTLWLQRGGKLYIVDLETGESRSVNDSAPVVSDLAFRPVRCERCDSSQALCLNRGRFLAEVDWRDHRNGVSGVGRSRLATDDTGLFWFFDEENPELMLKVLDGRPLNGHFWFFSGALTDVERTLHLTDLGTGAQRSYRSPAGSHCGQADTFAFPDEEPATAPSGAGQAPAFAPGLVAEAAPETSGACAPDGQTLCLLGGRFSVRVEWMNQRAGGTAGTGRAVPLSDASGLFWFFEESNLELAVKVLDGRALTGKFWVFYGSLTDVGFRLTVIDTETGAERIYENPPGRTCGLGDTKAL